MFKNFISALFKTPHRFEINGYQKAEIFSIDKNKLQSGGGFTLIEVMVVVTIIIIMSAVVFINYRPGNQQLALQRSAHKLAQDIRRAQEMAMSSRGEACGPLFKSGYGIKLSRLNATYPGRERYILFADCNNNKQYDALDLVIEEVKFEQGIIFNKMKFCQAGVWTPVDPGIGEDTIDIIFSPPDPERSIFTANPALNSATEQMLRLTIQGSNQFKCIYINKAGLIDVIECSITC